MKSADALHRQADALRAQADALDVLAEELEEELPDPAPPVADLTVAEIAEAHEKAESTVRQWLADVPSAYRLGNEIRVSRRAWRAYLDSLAGVEPDQEPDEGEDGGPGSDLGAWRDEIGRAS